MPTPKTLVIATTNPGKVPEFRTLLSRLLDLTQITLATPPELGVVLPPIEETGATFAENARLKAESVLAATGLPSVADDSGLCVDALEGAPGLYSARWAGEAATDADRIALLLQKLASVPPESRTARFVCAAAVAAPQRNVSVAEGFCEGQIAETRHGAGGFGYDPIFLLPSLGRTMAELSAVEKDTLSHRAQAFAGLAPFLYSLGFPSAILP